MVDGKSTFAWTNENTIILCEVCINFITKNGRNQQLKWSELEDRFAERVGRRCPKQALKNKYDAMKKDWHLWKFLKHGETGLGWDSTTGKLDCSDEWWGKKVQEKPEAKKFRFKGVLPLLEAKWDNLFGDSVATGNNVVAPSIDPNNFVATSNNAEEVLQDIEGGADDAYREYTEFYNRVESLDNIQGPYSQYIVQDINSNPPNTNPTNTNAIQNTKGVKRKRRESGGSAFMREHLQKVQEIHSDIIALMKENGTKKDDTSVDQVMNIMSHIDISNDVEVGGDIWCHAMLMFRDPATREIFIKMPNDAARKAWLNFAQAKNII